MAGATTASRNDAVAEAAAIPLEIYADSTEVSVGGHKVRIGKLTIDQWLALTLFVAKVFDAMPETDAEALRARAQGVTDDASFMSNIEWLMPLLKAEMVVELYSVLTQLDREMLRDSFDMVEFITVMEATAAHNDPPRIVSAFKRAAKRWVPRSPEN